MHMYVQQAWVICNTLNLISSFLHRKNIASYLNTITQFYIWMNLVASIVRIYIHDACLQSLPSLILHVICINTPLFKDDIIVFEFTCMPFMIS